MTAELPSRWSSATVGEVSTLVRGVTFKKSEASSQPDTGLVPIVRAGNVQDGRIRVEEDLVYVPTERVAPEQYLRSGDTLIATSSGSLSVVGKSAPVRNDWIGAHGAFMAVLRPHAGVQPAYLSYFLQSDRVRKLWRTAAAGTNINNLKKNDLLSTEVHVPPLPEQERIVAAIEEHFSRLDGVDVNLGSVASRVNILEQALINQAMKGERQRLGDHLAEPLRNGFSPPRSFDGNTRVLTLTAVTEREFTEENTKLAVVPQLKRDRLTLRPGDILVQRSNTPELVGTAALYSGPNGWAVFPDLLIRVRPDHTLMPAYLELALRSSEVRHYFRMSAQGIAGSMPKISQSTIEELEIRIPETISEQQSIVRRISIELQAVKEVQDCVSRACKRADLLRRVVLTAAFAGQLVPQNPGR